MMIGAAASGKSTAARILASILQERGDPPVRYISSAAIRCELYGDRGVIGRWQEIEAVIQQRLCDAAEAGQPVILEASYVKRSYRLAITQRLALPAPVQWIGWWLDTPLALCQEWNRRRDHVVPESVIESHCAHLLQCSQAPHRLEGFAAVVRLETAHVPDLAERIRTEAARLEERIVSGSISDRRHRLHGYARLLDHERLLYLIQLLCRYPKLTGTGAAADPELERLLSPLPEGDLAEQAAALLARLHGACYGDSLAVAADLEWLDRQGFTARWRQGSAAGPPVQLRPIEPPPWPRGQPPPTGGLPPLADRQAFIRALTVLRHLLHHPFDRGEGVRIDAHLAACLNRHAAASGSRRWTQRQVHEAITATLTPYGFRFPGVSGRHGYALGTALLPLDQLVEACGLLQLQADQLGDRAAAAIHHDLALHLERIGIDLSQHPPVRSWFPLQRPTPNEPSTGPRDPAEQARRIEGAIRQRQRVLLAVVSGDGTRGRELAVWPLRLILHAGSWRLLFEHDAIGQREGLLACEPIERLHGLRIEHRRGRDLALHRAALERAASLQRLCGSLHFGADLPAQLGLCRSDAALRATLMARLRFRCSAAVMPAIRNELDRFHPRAIRLGTPLPGHGWGRSEPDRATLRPGGDPIHPYPVEVDLPAWVLKGDPELRRWLFAYGAAIRLEAPAELVAEHRRWLADALALHGPIDDDSRPAAAEPARASAGVAGKPRTPRKQMAQHRTPSSPAARPI